MSDLKKKMDEMEKKIQERDEFLDDLISKKKCHRENSRIK